VAIGLLLIAPLSAATNSESVLLMSKESAPLDLGPCIRCDTPVECLRLGVGTQGCLAQYYSSFVAQ
jgi:hypothetical protein